LTALPLSVPAAVPFPLMSKLELACWVVVFGIKPVAANPPSVAAFTLVRHAPLPVKLLLALDPGPGELWDLAGN
jgi:hypothetical protein